MTNINIPAWAGSAETMARRVKPIIHLIAMGKSVSPSTIDDLVRPAGSSKAYSAKYITFLRLLGYDFSVQKDGRKIVSYTCITVPANASDIQSIAPKSAKAKAPKAAKVKAAKVAAPKAAKTTSTNKSLAAIKAKNLATLKAVGANQSKVAKRVREFDDVTEQFGSSGEVGTSFSVERDWDSIEGLDLQKLL